MLPIRFNMPLSDQFLSKQRSICLCDQQNGNRLGRCAHFPATRKVYIYENTIRKKKTLYRIKREVIATEFVRKHTSIPVPEILKVQLSEDDSWFLAQRLAGSSLELAWPNMSEEAKERTAIELQGYFKQLRNIHPPEAGFIGSCDGGPSYDHRLDNRTGCGPFKSVSEFNDFLVAPVRRCPRPERADAYRKHLSDSYDICFTHADIDYGHIFVEPQTGKVTGIIDWEMAGFWPEWWEYRKALYASRQHKRWWVDLVRFSLPNYQDVLELDCELEDY